MAIGAASAEVAVTATNGQAPVTLGSRPVTVSAGAPECSDIWEGGRAMSSEPDDLRKAGRAGSIAPRLLLPCLFPCLGTATCSDLSGPGAGGYVTPELRHLSFHYLETSYPDGGVLSIDGAPADTSFRLRQGQRVPVEIEVSSGDREEVGFYRELCPIQERVPVYDCFSSAVAVHADVHVAYLASHVAAIGGRFTMVFPRGVGGVVAVFDPEDLVRKARRAASWPGVRLVELKSSACPGIALQCRSETRSRLRLPVPVDTGVAVPGDGIVQIRPGDTVTVTYRQPGGGRLEAKRVVP